MKRLWLLLGRAAYPFTWPLQYLSINNSRRSRLVVMAESRVLVVKSWLGNGEWGLPGGGIHKTETDIESAIRELKEETGIEIEEHIIKPLAKFTNKHKGITVKFVAFTATLPSRLATKPQLGEIVDIAWLYPQQLLESGKLAPDARLILTKLFAANSR